MRALALVPPFLREASRTGLFVVAACLAVIALGISGVMGPLSLGTGEKITRDIGLASLVLLSALLVLVGGVHLVCKEIERRTVFLLITRPVSRVHYLIGKFAGLVALGWIVVALGALVFGTALVLGGQSLDAALGQAVLLAAFEVVVLSAIAVLYGSLTQPIPAMLYGLATFVAGHAMASLATLAGDTLVGPSRVLLQWLRWLFPDLSRFDMRLYAVHGIAVPATEVFVAFAYAVVYAAGVLCLSCALFAKREFK
jgi:ABC-type transport system involved in multi-copper enzyme maturation permease subunit